MPEPTPTATPATSRTRRRRRLALISIGAVLAALLIGLFAVTRSAVLVRIVEPRLAHALGADVDIGHASLGGAFSVVLRDVSVDARSLNGQPARVLTVDRLVARVEWIPLLTGGMGVREARFESPTIRLSQDKATLRLNLEALDPARSSAPSSVLPRVLVSDATIEFGEHDASSYTPLASIHVDGELRRAARDSGRYQIALVESVDSARSRAPANPVPITLSGEFDPIAVEGALTLENVDLASWGPAAAPSDVRAFWTQLALQGAVDRTEFLYSEERGVEARFSFSNVALSLPIAADPQADLETAPGPRAEPERYMRVSSASGTATLGAEGIRAAIEGLIEDLPYRVEVASDSVALNTGFTIAFETAEPFSVAERPQLLPFAPRIVRDRFRSFSGPTAMLEASVVVSRDPPTPQGPGELHIAGVLTLTNGQAAYASFPYPFQGMTGQVRFDEEAIHIDEITGVSESGATLTARGVIAPPVDGAEVAIDVRIDDIPLDEQFSRALPSSRANLLDELFNRDSAQRLRERGLLPDDFTLGGVGSLDIRVRRPLGEDSEWSWDATLDLPRAGLLVERFPYPAYAESTTVYVTSDYAEVRIPMLRPVGGGEGDLRGTITLHDASGESVFVPVILVRALGVPVGDHIAAALTSAFREDASTDAADLLAALAVEGDVDVTARVLPRDDDEIGFDVAIEFRDLIARPGAADPSTPPLLSAVNGRMEFSETAVRVHEFSARLADATLRISGDAAYRSSAQRDTDLLLEADGLRLESRFDQLLAPFDAAAAQRLRAGLDAINATGDLDVRLRVTREPAADGFTAHADVLGVRSIGFDAMGGRVAVRDARGAASLQLVTGKGAVAVFDAFTAEARMNESDPATLSLQGELDLRAFDESTTTADPAEPKTLEVAAQLSWPSAFADSLLDRAAAGRADRIRAVLDRWGAQVEGDLRVVIASSPAGAMIRGAHAAPRRIVLARGEQVVPFTVDRGTVEYADAVLRINDLALSHDSISVVISGDATTGAAPSLNLALTGTVAPFDAAARSLFPEAIRDALDAASVAADSLSIRRAQLAVGDSTALEADLAYQGLALDLGGTDVAEADGELVIRVDTADPRPLDATLSFDSARVQRLRLGKGEARIILSEGGRSLVIPSFDAEAYGGRVFGVAKVETMGEQGGLLGSGNESTYEIETSLAGLGFEALRADLRVGDAPESEELAERSGVVDATLSVAGRFGVPGQRVGRGAVRVWGGEVLRLPLAARLIELSNLQLPTAAELDFAQAAFHIEGGTISFEELGVESDSVSLLAAGSLAWPSLELDLDVTSRGARRAPILSDLVEALRNELLVTRVTGPLSEPVFTVETLPSTRRFLDSIFGGSNDRPPPARPASRSVGDAATSGGR